MFRSRSIIALPVLLLPMYGAATALPLLPQTSTATQPGKVQKGRLPGAASDTIETAPVQQSETRENILGHRSECPS
jgi:hypothetical protein